MAGSLNKVMLIGRLGQDPELRYTQSGQAVCNLRMATDESFNDRDGNRQERTEWHSVVVWGRQAETSANYLAKGRLVYVEGSLQTRKWQDREGKDRYTTEVKALRVQFLDSNRDNFDSGGASRQGGRNQQQPQGGGGGQQPRNQQQGQGQSQDEDLGPAFPSEASGMDDVPF